MNKILVADSKWDIYLFKWNKNTNISHLDKPNNVILSWNYAIEKFKKLYLKYKDNEYVRVCRYDEINNEWYIMTNWYTQYMLGFRKFIINL